MKVLNRIVFTLLIFTIPFTAVFIAANVTFRLPDVYKFELSRTEVLGELEVNESEDRVAEFISSYMLDKEDSFQMQAEYKDKIRNIFSPGEGEFMATSKSYLDISFIALCLMLVFIIFAYWFLRKQKRKTAIRFAYKGGWIVYIIFGLAATVTLALDRVRNWMMGFAFKYEFTDSDLLPQFFGRPFALESVAAIVIISLIILLAGMSITWRLTKPERIFW